MPLAKSRLLAVGEAETVFRKIRWSSTEGAAVCPECGGLEPYKFRRPTGLLRFRCKACSKNFSITSGTLSPLSHGTAPRIPRRDCGEPAALPDAMDIQIGQHVGMVAAGVEYRDGGGYVGEIGASCFSRASYPTMARSISSRLLVSVVTVLISHGLVALDNRR